MRCFLKNEYRKFRLKYVTTANDYASMMEVIDRRINRYLIKNRYSLRNFDTEKIPTFDDIRDIIEAGRFAPSFLNLQPWHFIVIKDKNMKNITSNY